MKSLQCLAILCSLSLIASAQEAAPKWDVEIPGPMTDESPAQPKPQPEPMDFAVLSSRATQMEVTRAPEMADLPPIQDRIQLTMELVADPKLPDPASPLPASPPDDPDVVARMEEFRKDHRGTEVSFMSATIYDNHRAFLRIYSNGKLDETVSAWSNRNLNHFSGFASYRVNQADGTLRDFGLLMGIGNTNTSRVSQLAAKVGNDYEPPEIPKLPDLAFAGTAFVVVEGNAESPAMDTVEQVHDLYRKEGGKMEAAYYAREMARAERKAFLLATPPKPADVTIRYWKGEPIANGRKVGK